MHKLAQMLTVELRSSRKLVPYHTVWYSLSMARKTKRDWFDEAIQVLLQDGADGLTIDNLTTRLGVTKGSFYHHFGNQDGFKEQLLHFFEHEGTLDVVARVNALADEPRERLQALLQITLEYPSTIEVAIRTWAQRDAVVRDYQQRVDERRIAYVTELWQSLGHSTEQAQLRSQLLYTILVGSEHILPPIEGADKMRLYQEYLRMYED